MHLSHLALWATAAFAEVVDLKPADFVPESMPGTWVVKFFSPYCGGCTLYAPVYEESEAKSRKKGSRIKYAAVNCVENGDLCNEKGIKGWPALKVYKDGKFVDDAEVNRDSSDFLVQFLESREDKSAVTPSSEGSKISAAASAASSVATSTTQGVAETAAATKSVVQELKDLEPGTLNGLHIVKFYSPYCSHCSEYAPIYERVAKALPDTSFDAVNCIEQGDLCAAAKVKAWPELRVYRDGKLESTFDKRDFTYKGTIAFLKQFGIDPKSPAQSKAESAPESIKVESIQASPSSSAQKPHQTPAEAAESDKQSSDFIPSNLPAPVWTSPISVSHADGKSLPMGPDLYKKLVLDEGEPWMVKFYHPQCPHCRAMAPEWEKYAQQSKGKMNIAQVNCESDFDLCLDTGLKSYPTVAFYVKGTKHVFNGAFTIQEFQNYDRLQTGAQVLHVRSPEELEGYVESGNYDGSGIFVYIYDDSVTNEDWDALVEQAKYFPAINSVIFHTSSTEIRKNAGIDTHGTALVYISKFNNPETNNVDTFYYTYPDSHSPELLRDVDRVVEWADSVRFSSPIHLELDQVSHLSKHSGISVVKISPSNEVPAPKFRHMAKQAHESALLKQAQNQESLREQRSELYESLKKRGKATIANSVLKTPINSPFIGERSFVFIDTEEWNEQFGPYIDTSNHEYDNIIVIDWYNGRYLDKLNDQPLKLEDVENATNILLAKKSEVRPLSFKKNFRKLPKYFKPQAVFKPNLNMGQNIQKMEKKHLSVTGVILALVLFWCGRAAFKLVATRWRNSSGPIITGKMD